jgi:L-asparaginase
MEEDETTSSIPRLAVIGLGGTIAMHSRGSGAVPGLTAEDLVELLPEEATRLIHHVESFRQAPGAHLMLDDLVALAARIRQLTADEEVNGVVVVQGTDTIEETVFALEILLDGPVPVVVTGAMRHAGQISSDGAANLANSVYLAAAPDAAGRGAMACFNDEVHAAFAVQKTAATNPAAFSSPGFGPVGHVIEGRADLLMQARRWPAVCSDPATVRPAPVAMVAAALGESPALLNAVASNGYRGCVVQALGAGHLPDSWVEPLTDLAQEIPVVLATRVSRGPTLSSTYAFPGSESDLLKRGLLPAAYLSASKARILLSMALGAGIAEAGITSLFSDTPA